MGFRWSISVRSVTVACAAVAITALAGLGVQRSVIRRQGIESARESMKNILLAAESCRAAVAAMNTAEDFDRPKLTAEALRATDFRSVRLYGTIPVVAAWQMVEKVASKEGYDFRISAHQPRNPKNLPTAAEERILSALSSGGREDYFAIEEARNEMVYARPIVLGQECMVCHGKPGAQNREGKDLLGFRMEGWQPGQMHGAFILRTKMDKVDAQVQAGLYEVAMWITPIAIVLGFAAFRATSGIRGPLHEAVSVLRGVAEGDLTQEIHCTSNDEIGDMAEAVRRMSGGLRAMVAEIAAGVNVLANSSAELAANSEQVGKSSQQVSDRAHSVAAAMEEVNSNVVSVAAGMEQTTANLGNVAGSTGQMTSTITDIARISEKARSITEGANLQAAQITQKMNSLGHAAREIDKVTEVITEISAQTNLLALNATIEAARAGAAGKGFAVVATEIKHLAQQTATATEDIRNRISDVQQAAASGISEIGQISVVIHEVSEIVSSIAVGIEEQAAATHDIADYINQASAGVGDANERVSQTAEATRQVAADILEVHHATEEMTGSSKQVQATIVELTKLSDQLKATVARFKA